MSVFCAKIQLFFIATKFNGIIDLNDICNTFIIIFKKSVSLSSSASTSLVAHQ